MRLVPGGSWDNFIGLYDRPTLRGAVRLASLDRPGYGGSGRGRVDPSLARQAAAVAAVVDTEGHGRPAVLVGHSLGGPIVARAAVDFPSRVSGLVLLAPSIDPVLERPWWIQRPADWPLLAWLLPVELRTANRELLPLAAELAALAPRLGEPAQPVTVIHGRRDDLVPVANAAFVERAMTAAAVTVVRPPELDHLIPWRRPDLVERAILDQVAGPPPLSRGG